MGTKKKAEALEVVSNLLENLGTTDELLIESVAALTEQVVKLTVQVATASARLEVLEQDVMRLAVAAGRIATAEAIAGRLDGLTAPTPTTPGAKPR